MFPILNDPIIRALPWSLMEPHAEQALRNHSQSLQTLARRGGLSITEAYCVLKDTDYRSGTKFKLHVVRLTLMRLYAMHVEGGEPRA